MAYRYNGIECDTLQELNALKAQEISQRVRAEHAASRKQCSELVLTQGGGLGLAYERCGYYEGHEGPCEP